MAPQVLKQATGTELYCEVFGLADATRCKEGTNFCYVCYENTDRDANHSCAMSWSWDFTGSSFTSDLHADCIQFRAEENQLLDGIFDMRQSTNYAYQMTVIPYTQCTYGGPSTSTEEIAFCNAYAYDEQECPAIDPANHQYCSCSSSDCSLASADYRSSMHFAIDPSKDLTMQDNCGTTVLTKGTIFDQFFCGPFVPTDSSCISKFSITTTGTGQVLITPVGGDQQTFTYSGEEQTFSCEMPTDWS
jgi:hypothetical protein